VLNESKIKAAIIEKLISQRLGVKRVIINEMVVGKSDRRADLVMVGRGLSVFEIKSDLDTLKRLKDQVDVYVSHFDKITLVVASKFVDAVIADYPPNIAVWEAFESAAGAVVLRVRRQGGSVAIVDVPALASLLLKSELDQFAKINKIVNRPGDFRREELITLFDGAVPVSRFRKYVAECVGARYEEMFLDFVANKNQTVAVGDLSRLSKSKVKKRELEERLIPLSSAGYVQCKRELNLSKFFPDGIVPESIPTYVSVPS
jgi:hypothetical protein